MRFNNPGANPFLGLDRGHHVAHELVLWVPFADGSGMLAKDYAGLHTLAAFNYGDDTWVPGRFNAPCAFFDGATSSRYFRATSGPLNETDQFTWDTYTICLWYKSAELTMSDDEYCFFHGRDTIQHATWVNMRVTDDSGKVGNFVYHQGQTTSTELDSGIDVVDQQWHHLAVAQTDGGTLRIFVDGVQENTASAHTPITQDTGATQCTVGDKPGSTEQVHGCIQDVRVYKRELGVHELREVIRAPWQGLISRRARIYFVPAGGASTPILIDDVAHAHTLDVATTGVPLVTADVAHAHSLDVATTGVPLVAADVLHAHALDQPTFLHEYVLAVNGMLHAHGIDVATTGVPLIIADVDHAHTAENATVLAGDVLDIAGVIHSHSTDQVTTGVPLAIDDVAHVHVLANATTGVPLILADVAHAHALENTTILTGAILDIADVLHAHALEEPTLSHEYVLVVADVAHAHILDQVGVVIPGASISGARIYAVPRESRIFSVPPETRIYKA